MAFVAAPVLLPLLRPLDNINNPTLVIPTKQFIFFNSLNNSYQSFLPVTNAKNGILEVTDSFSGDRVPPIFLRYL